MLRLLGPLRTVQDMNISTKPCTKHVSHLDTPKGERAEEDSDRLNNNAQTKR